MHPHLQLPLSHVVCGALTTLLTLTGCPGDDTSGTGDDTTTDGPTTGMPTTTMPTDPSATMTMSGSGDTTTTDPDDSGTDTSMDTTGEPVVCEVAPGDWDAPDWEANTVDALALRAQLDTLTGDATMRGAETGAVMITDVADLTAVWDGTPSLAAVANPGFAPIVDDAFAEFVDVIAAGDNDLIDAMNNWDPGPAGGIWGDSDRGINEGGLEVRQLVDKGGYSGGVNYAYAVSLTEGDITPATIDAIAAIWGNNAVLDTKDLTDGANYSYQMGFHGDMAAALADAKAYAADEACEAELEAALVTFFNNWEQSMAARLVFYGNRAEGKLVTAMTDSDFADVLHDLAEGIGVLAGFYGLPDPASGPLSDGARIVTDADIEAAMAAFGVDLTDLGLSTTGLFVESLPNLEAANTAAEMVVMDVYGVDAAGIVSYIMPTPG